MHIRQLEVRDFRNYSHALLHLNPGVVVLAGANGQGKTNLLEAARYLSVFSSHRVSSDRPLVRAGAEEAVIRGDIVHGSRRLGIDCLIRREGANTVRLGGAPRRAGEVMGMFATVLFAPEDLALVSGAPEVRRRFLDELLIERRPRLVDVVRGYDRVLRQRNSLLKSAKIHHLAVDRLESLDVWNGQLAALGAELVIERARLVAELAEPLERAYRAISGEATRAVPSLRSALLEPAEGAAPLPTPASLAADYLQRLEAGVADEVQRGSTALGPHRDDLDLTLDGLVARDYASHGESWSLALALRLAAAEVLRATSPAGDPVLMLDDVFAELDADRRRRLAALVAPFEQVIVTSAIADDIPAFGMPLQRIHIAAGAVADGQAAPGESPRHSGIRAVPPGSAAPPLGPGPGHDHANGPTP